MTERRRLSAADWCFTGFMALYVGAVLVVLAEGVLSAAAATLPGLHTHLHQWGFAQDWFGRQSLATADASHRVQPPVQLGIDYGFSLFNLALAGFLLWLRPRDLTARLLAVAMVGTAAVFNLQAHGTYEALTATAMEAAAHYLIQLVAAASYIFALLLFPDGRLVPRWSRRAQALLYVPIVTVVAALAFQARGTSRTVALIVYFGLATPVAAVAGQAYRFRRSPTPVERRQARLLIWALAPALLMSLFVLTRTGQAGAFGGLEGRSLPVVPAGLFRVFQPVFAVIPVALFVGLLRYRLWNIDRVISRALLYGLLAGFVTVVYVGIVVGLGRLVGAQGGNLGLSVVATGVVAVAFAPVKARVDRLANRLVYGRRATPYEVLSELATRMTGTVATEDLLSRLACLLAQGTGAIRADVWLALAGELRLAASWPAGAEPRPPLPLRDDDLPTIDGVSEAVPVRHEHELLGALTVSKPGAEQLLPTERKLLGEVGAQAGLVLRNGRLTAELLVRLEELRASRQRVIAAQDEARRRLERNVHDGAQQQLVALKVQLALAEHAAADGEPVAEMLGELKDQATEALENLRDLARGIYPPLLAAEGLPVALRGHARRLACQVEIETDGCGRYPQEVETAVYFCCLEALQNISKYAGASKVVVGLRSSDGWLQFTVGDDGGGFDPDSVCRGSGYQNMADRIEALDGTLELTSRPGLGTTVTGRIPLAVGSRS